MCQGGCKCEWLFTISITVQYLHGQIGEQGQRKEKLESN